MMSLGAGSRSSFPDDTWDEVWDSYDARQAPSLPVRPASLQQEQTREGRGRVLLVAMTAAVLLLLAATAFAAAPLQAARGIADAFRTADRAGVQAVVDWSALRGIAPPPPAVTPAEHFLSGLTRIVQQHAATPEGLLAYAQARIGPGWPEPLIEATGFGTARLTLLSTTQAGRGIALSLALRDSLPLRWVVVAVEPLG
ncbi:MAG: DUF2939 domain-containing protein [Acetobacteraceae bacterium]|nr:MAG: DUF2939 domain-containing protein [Acetobacteraceae bacterium]